MEQIIIGLIIILLAYVLFKRFPLEKKNVRKLTLSAIFIVVIVVCKRFFTLTIPFFGVESFQVGIEYIPAMIAGIILSPSYAFMIGLACDMIGLILVPTGFPFLGFTLSMILVVVIPSLIKEYTKNTNPYTLYQYITVFMMALPLLLALFMSQLETITISSNIVELTLPIKLFLIIISLLLSLIVCIVIYKYKKTIQERELRIFVIWVLSVLGVELITTVILSPLWLALMYDMPFFVSLCIRIVKECFIIPLNIFLGYPILRIIQKNI